MRSFFEEQLGKAIAAAESEFLGRERRFVRGLQFARLKDSQLWLQAREKPPAARTVERVCRVLGDKLRDSLQIQLDLHVTQAHARASEDGEPIVDASNLEAVRALEAYAGGALPDVPWIYIYGAIGLGKTWLLDWFQRQVEAACVRWDALALHREIQSARRLGKLSRLRDSLLDAEILLVDEVHRLRGKRRTQEELGRVVDELSARRRRIVMTGRHHPYQIYEFQPPLASRLLGGYTIELRMPTPETRTMFARKLWHERVRGSLQERGTGRGGEEELGRYLAWMRSARSYAELLERAEAFADGAHGEVVTGSADAFPASGSGASASDTDSEGAPPAAPPASGDRSRRDQERYFEDLLGRVAGSFDIAPETLRQRDSSRRVAVPRQVLAFVGKQSGLNAAELARRLGWRSSSSINYSCERVRLRMEREPEFARFVEKLL